MDPDQVPNCLPGMNSQTPDDSGLYWKGYIETPVQPYGRHGHGPDGYGPYGAGHGIGPTLIEQYDGSTPDQVIPSPAPAPVEVPSARLPVRRKGTVAVSDGPQNGPRPALSSRRPAYAHVPPAASNRSSSYNPSIRQARQSSGQTKTDSDPPGFIGPIGYDVKK